MPETVFEAALRVAKTNGAQNQLTGQDDQNYLFSVLKALSTCDQDKWDQLGFVCPEAHKWYEAGAIANKNGTPIPFPQGYKPVILQKPPQKPVVKEPVKPPVPVAITKPEPRKEREKQSKNSGILDAVRRTVALNQSWNAKQVHEHLLKNGFPEVSHALVAVNVGDIKRTINVLRELGLMKELDAAEKKTA